jgi:hypothetical protein
MRPVCTATRVRFAKLKIRSREECGILFLIREAKVKVAEGSALQVMLYREQGRQIPVDSACCRLPFARQHYLDTTIP